MHPPRHLNMMAIAMANLEGKSNGSGNGGAIFRATWMEKTDGGKGNGNIGGKRTLANPRRGIKHGWQIQWHFLRLRAKNKGNTCGKAMAKIVAKCKGWTRKWEILGKSEPSKEAHCMAT